MPVRIPLRLCFQFFWVYSQKWNSWITWEFHVQFPLSHCHTISHGGCTILHSHGTCLSENHSFPDIHLPSSSCLPHRAWSLSLRCEWEAVNRHSWGTLKSNFLQPQVPEIQNAHILEAGLDHMASVVCPGCLEIKQVPTCSERTERQVATTFPAGIPSQAWWSGHRAETFHLKVMSSLNQHGHNYWDWGTTTNENVNLTAVSVVD